MNCAYTGTCLLGMVIPEHKCVHSRESSFLFYQENPVSLEARTNSTWERSVLGVTRQGETRRWREQERVCAVTNNNLS